ncbi:hypothetical protein HLB42_09695 [Deinococcus sp. D7000]|nr:hypothetical protein HLB42_09695 [Deinococcus sp. D7000]
MTLACPKCGGNQLQSIRMIYEGGVNRSSMSGYTFATDGSNNSVGAFQGTKTSTSALAQRFAPPDTGRVDRIQKSVRESWMLGAIPLAIGLFFLVASVSGNDYSVMNFIVWPPILLGAGFIAYGFYEKSKIDEATQQDYRAGEKLLEWSNTVVCHTCGNQFIGASSR